MLASVRSYRSRCRLDQINTNTSNTVLVVRSLTFATRLFLKWPIYFCSCWYWDMVQQLWSWMKKCRHLKTANVSLQCFGTPNSFARKAKQMTTWFDINVIWIWYRLGWDASTQNKSTTKWNYKLVKLWRLTPVLHFNEQKIQHYRWNILELMTLLEQTMQFTWKHWNKLGLFRSVKASALVPLLLDCYHMVMGLNWLTPPPTECSLIVLIINYFSSGT